MARNENPPFGRGETFYNGGTIDSNNLGGTQLEGKEFVFEDVQYNVSGQVGAKPNRTNRYVRCRIVRNVGAVALLPKQCVTFQKTALVYGARVDGEVRLDAERTYPIDEWLPAAGCPVNDLCYVVVEGPATVRTSLGADATNVFNVGDGVIALTAATSGATTAGRVQPQLNYWAGVANALTSIQSATVPNSIMNLIGRALSAATTANTNSDLLVEVGKW